MLDLVDVDDHGVAAKLGLEGVAIDEESAEIVHEAEHVGFAVDVHPLRFGV